MRIIESRSIDNQAGLLGSRLITGTNAIEGAFQSFIVAEDTVVTKVYNSIGIDVTSKLGLTSITLKAGAFISMPKGDYFSSIKLASGSIVAYFTSHGGQTITVDAYLNEFLARVGSSYLEASECVKAHLQQLINIGLLQKASLIMSPSMYEEDLVKSVVPQDASGDLSFTRASNGTRINSAGLVEVAPWNLIRYSEEFDNTAWVKANSTVTANQTTAPNGTTTADKIEISSATNATVQQGVSSDLLISGLPCTFTVYLKSVSGTGKVGIRSGQTGLISLFNFTNEWQRFTWTFNSAASLEIPQFCNNTLVGGADAAPTFYVWGAQLNIGSTAKPYFPTTDRLNVPRLTYQNGGGGCPSLLLEKQSTNLIVQSQALAGSPWVIQTGSILDNNTISPDGTQNASKLTDITVYEGMSVDIGATYTATMYAKLGTATNICLVINNQAAWNTVGGVSFTTSNGLIANEWARVQYTFTAPLTGAINLHIGGHGQTGLTPQSAGTVFVWGVQVEKSSYATSYIPTTSSSATRVADACFKTGISSLIGQTEGVIFADFVWEGSTTGGADYPLSIYASSYSDFVGLNTYENTNSMYVYVGGSNVVAIAGTTFVNGQRYKIAMAYKLNDFVYYLNGTQMGADTSGSVPSSMANFQTVTPFAGKSTSQKYNEIILFPTRLTNAELASLTTI